MTELLPVAILAGGLATRLQPLTASIPKALVEVGGEPFIAHQLRLLKRQGIDRVVVCAGYLGELIEDYVGDGSHFGLQVEFVYDGSQLRGTAGALKRALPRLGEACFVLYGDSYLTCEFEPIQAAFAASGKLALMTIFRNESRWGASNIEFAAGTILRYDKHSNLPSMQHIDYGLGILGRGALELVPTGAPYDLATLYADLLKCDKLAAFEVAERFYEIGSFEGLEDMRTLLNHLRAEPTAT
jgi:NDP-sugar pyrophosphorylase family protein